MCVPDATHLVLKVISDQTNAHLRDRGDVLGNALLAGDGTGYYAYAFQDHIGILERKRGSLSPSVIGDRPSPSKTTAGEAVG